ncbi:MAG: signal peptidase I [Candidatus Peregrinibacteria bacterium]|nr:signal peptidase I [Candidatus Peregrinibacteria bacterium]MDZ4245251.1 signal peptidase I [Candidatus Gracilibacteria bacterium]
MKKTENKTLQAVFDLILNIVIIGLLVVLIRSFIVSPFQVSGPSMCDTLNFIDGACVPTGGTIGEFMLINKFSYLIGSPKRGDIIVFKPDSSEQFYIKRIIGIPGDTIKIKNNNFVYITPKDGEEMKLNETYLNSTNYGNTKVARENLRTFHVPEGKYFAMGDNRAHSSDSRRCFQSFGECQPDDPSAFISPDVISGKAFITLWPPSNMKLIRHFDYEF